jgi:SAM-dependent methyltransferase
MDLVEIPGSDFRRHPWEVVRARFFGGVLDPILSGRSTTLLDVGAGDGWLAAGLAARHPRLTVTCFDTGYAELPADALPATPRVIHSAELPDGPFDAISLLDVLEHIEADEEVLGRLVSESLRPGGHALVSVPAWPRLYSHHDVALRHFRRYAPRDIAGRLRRAGLTLLRHGGLFHSLLAVRTLAVARERRGTPDSADGGGGEHRLEWQGGELSKRLVEAALSTDAGLSRLAARTGVEVPGLSWWALCRRP